MSTRFTRTTSIVLLMMVVTLLLSLTACNIGTTVRWIDADGGIIREERYLILPDNLLDEDLPEDSERWHYTEWKEVKTKEKDTRVIALRGVRKREHVWMSIDDTVIARKILLETDDYTNPALPKDTDKWDYVGWVKEVIEDKWVHTIKCLPNTKYLYGNVFQIKSYKKDGYTMSLGTGFIIDSSGLFITNEHVMRDSYMAKAVFYTGQEGKVEATLAIDGGIEVDKELDIFVGRIANYHIISDNYRPISFRDSIDSGERVFALGYPDGVTNIVVSSGKTNENVKNKKTADPDDYYITSSAELAEGSSGGVLVNDKLEVVGITTIGVFDSENMEFVAGYAVPTTFFYHLITRAKNGKVVPFSYLYPHVA